MASRDDQVFVEAAIGFARSGLKGLFLANGVAAITSLTTIGTMLGKPGVQTFIEPLAVAATRFGWGVAVALVSAAFAYVAQVLFSEFWVKRHWPGAIVRILALVAAFASIALFVWGVETAASGFIGAK